MSIAHPYAPDADWRIAVSRRFHNDHAEAVYHDVILPVISGEGIVLECSWAANDVSAADDFWTRRMRLILQVADIHLLLDIDRTPNMEFEFDISRRLSRKGRSMSGLSKDPVLRALVIRPIGLRVDEGDGRSAFSAFRNCAFVHIGIESEPTKAQAKLREQIEKIKLIRIKRILRSQRLSEMLEKPMALRANAPYEDVRCKLVQATRFALGIRDARTTEEIGLIAGPPTPAHDDKPVAQLSKPPTKRSLTVMGNRVDNWVIKLTAGQATLPAGFWDSYREVRRTAEANMVKLGIEQKALYSFPFRYFLFLFYLVVNIGVRRKERKAHSK